MGKASQSGSMNQKPLSLIFGPSTSSILLHKVITEQKNWTNLAYDLFDCDVSTIKFCWIEVVAKEIYFILFGIWKVFEDECEKQSEAQFGHGYEKEDQEHEKEAEFKKKIRIHNGNRRRI